MKLTIEGSAEEIKNTLQAIYGSEKRVTEYSGLADLKTGNPVTRGHSKQGSAKSVNGTQKEKDLGNLKLTVG